MNLWKKCLQLMGWSVEITAPRRDRCVICVAPHTSNMDFLLGIMAYKSLRRKANFLMKKFWFFFPLKYLLNSLGGIPVDRTGKSRSLTETIIEDFAEREYMNLAVTPEGTRSARKEWHTGFLRIAVGAGVPVQLGVIDYNSKTIIIKDEIWPSGDLSQDLKKVKDYYARFGNVAKYPNNFLL